MSPNSQIAIVGVSALFPGSSNARGFWRDILAGKDLLTEVPPSHWLLGDYYDPDPKAPDKTYASRGAFLSEVDFAPMEYGVPPNILSATDSSQLLALLVARQVLEDAARGPFENLDRERMGVVLGVASTTELCLHMAGRLQRPVIERVMRQYGLDEADVEALSRGIAEMYVPWEENTFPGLLGNVVSGRIANRFDLGGTNAVIDAACASSLAAVEMAVNKLQLGQADMMITGGVDALNDILMYMCFSKTGALSLQGDCRPFSTEADGTMMAEGLGMFALKRLEDAESDGDQIYAVIRGIGSSSDGRAKSIYAPRPEGQSRALRRAYEAAEYSPATVELLEAHGTATKAGDAAEIRGLEAVFSADEDGESSPRRTCALGSVKSQIGHAKAAAGAAGVFKAVMALNHRVLPPTIKVDQPNPELGLERSPFYLNTEKRPWVRDREHPRRASVSAFGFGGTNFHITLEEYAGSGERAPRRRTFDSELVLLSAETPADLIDRGRELVDDLGADGDLRFVAKTTQEAFDVSLSARLAIVGCDEAEIVEKLEQALAKIETEPDAAFSFPHGIHYGDGLEPGEVAVLFPGQGSQYVGMGADLAMSFDEVVEVWDEVAELEFEGEETRLHDVVFPTPVFSEEERTAQQERLTATQWAQPAIGATSLSMLRLLQELGLEMGSVGGHSYGEVMALCAAGVLGEREMLEVSRQRGELMANASDEPGAMIAVAASISDLEPKLESWDFDVVVANHNGPTQVVLSGATDAIEKAEERLTEEGVTVKRLPVSTAFHSSLVTDSTEPFLEFLEEIEFSEPDIPVYSNSEAAPYPDDPAAMRRCLAEQIARPVRFLEQVRAMWERGARTFVEIGPRNVSSRLVGDCLEGREHHCVSLDRRGKDGITTLWNALGHMSVLGLPIDFEPLWRGYDAVTDPREEADPGFTVPIDGANYDKPYPPKDLDRLDESGTDEARVEPAAASTPVTSGHDIPSKPINEALRKMSDQPHDDDRRSTHNKTNGRNGAARMEGRDEVPLPGRGGAPGPYDSGPYDSEQNFDSGQSSHGANGHAEYREPTSAAERQAWVRAYEEQQRQTAEAHRAVQQMIVESHRTFLQTMDRSFDALTRMMGGEPPAPPHHPEPSPSSGSERHGGTSALSAQGPVHPAGPTERRQAAPTPRPRPGARSMAERQQPVGPPSRPPAGASGQQPPVSRPTPQRRPPANAATPPPEPANAPAAPVSEPEPEADRAAEQPEQAEQAEGIDLSALLLEVLSDKTGYPREMLKPQMELESDLGVDSIKRVEILAEMEERVPQLPELDTADMAELRRLDEITDYLQALMGGRESRSSRSSGGDSRSDTESSEDDSESDPASGLERYTVRLVDSPATGMSVPALSAAETIHVVGDESGLGPTLVESLEAAGLRAEHVADVPAGADSVIFLGGLADVETAQDGLDVGRRAFHAARTLVNAAEKDPLLFVTVQDTGGDFGLSGEAGDRAWLAGSSAISKTANAEWPGTSVKAIDLDREGRSLEEQADAIVSELLAGGPEIEVGLPEEGGRTTLIAANAAVQSSSAGVDLDQNSVIVVSGGARGVTATAVVALAQRTAAHFVLLGRTELLEEPDVCRGVEGDAALKRVLLEDASTNGREMTPRELQSRVRHVLACREIRETLDRLDAAGSTAWYVSVDVRDADALGAAFSEVRDEWGPITGIVHGAGVLSDALISKKTDDQFERVVSTKVEGLAALLEATGDDPLDLICVFSSVAARSGNPGQCDYAMANETLNRVVAAEARRRGPECYGKALGWGPWDGGMVTPSLKKHFERAGVVMIPPQVGGEMFVTELLDAPAGDVEVLIGGSVSEQGLNGAWAEGGRDVALSVDASSHPYLGSHTLDEVPVVPAMLVLEWFLRLARACRPDLQVVRCRDLDVRSGIKLSGWDAGGDTFLLSARQEGDPDSPTLSMELRGEEGALHYTASVDMQRERPIPPDGLSDEYVFEAEESEIPLERAYDDGHLFHGADFEVLAALRGIDTRGGVASLRGVRSMGWPDAPWFTDPAALDGALQVGLLWGLQTMGKQTLPMRVERFTPFVEAPLDEPIECLVRGRSNSSKRNIIDVLLRSESGECVAEMRGVQMYAVPEQV